MKNHKSGKKSNFIGRALTDPDTNVMQPIIVDYARTDRQRKHMNHLFGLGQKYANETPSTEGTTVETPPEPISFERGNGSQKPNFANDSSQGNAQTAHSGCVDFFHSFFKITDTLCVRRIESESSKTFNRITGIGYNGNGEISDAGLSEPISIPREISFSKTNNGSLKSTSSRGYSVLNYMEELKDRPPSLLGRFALRQRNKDSKVTVYIDKPQRSKDWSTGASVDHSALTTPSDCH